MAKDVIRTITVRGKEENLDAVANKLRKVGQEAKAAGDGVQKLGPAATEGGRQLGNLDRQLENLDKRLAGAPRAFADFERNSRLLQRGLDAGKVSAAEFSRQMAELQTRLQKTIAPRLGMDIDSSGLRKLIDGQVELDAATRRTVLSVVQSQQQIERAMDAAALEVAEFGTELERLRAKYNPVYAAAKQYDAELKELNRAQQLGAISAKEHASALELLDSRYKQAASGANALDANSGMAQQQVRNLAFQFQDIGTMMAAGQSPFMLLAQQLPQVTMYGGQLNGVMGALKQTFGSLISPLGLLTAGFVIAGSAAISYFRDTNDEADATADVLRDQENLIQRVADRWGDAVPALRDYAKAIKDAREAADLQIASQIVQNSYLDQVRELLPEVAREMARFQDSMGSLAIFTQPQLELAAQAMYDAYAEAERALRAAEVALKNNEDASEDLTKANEALAALLKSEAIPATGSMRDAVEKLAEAYELAAERARKLNQQQAIAAAREANRRRFDKAGPRLGEGTLPSLSDTRFNERFGWDTVFDFPDDGAKKNREAERAAERLARAYDRLFSSAQRQIDQMRMEVGLVGEYGVAAEALRFQFDLVQEAREQGIELGDKEMQQIKDLTAAYRELAAELATLQAMDDIMFDRSLIGLSAGDQEILSFLRQLGIEADSANGQMIAGQMRYNQVLEETQAELEEMHALGKDAFMSILDLLYETGDIGEKLIGIFAGIGKQFARMGMERLWKSLTGEGSSIFDGISGSAKGSFSPVQAAQVGREIGNSISPAISTSLNDNLQSYAAAIRKIESGSYEGNYGALGPVVGKGSYAGDRAYGAYQIMGKNIGSWTKEVLGTSMSIKDFLADRSAQDKVFFAKFGQSLDKFGNFADATSVWFSGRPLNRAGNSSDGYNTVPQYVSKAEDALQNYPGIRTGVRDGTIDAANRLQHRVVSKSGGGESAPGIFEGDRFKGLMGVGAAGLGAFFGGMQSGSPVMGAISGAMTGLGAAPMIASAFPAMAAMATPIGLIGGAIIGLIGGLIGRSRQKKQELRQAQQELESQMGAITQMIRTATGNFMGQYEKSLMETSDEFAKAIAMATKAKNNKLANELRQAQEEFFERTAENWVRSFEGMIASLKSGMGFDGEFMAGMDAVEKMRESLVGFVNDAKMFAESGGDLSAYVGAARGNKSAAGIFNPGGYLNPYQEVVLISDPGGGYQEFKKNEFIDGYLDIANQMFELGIQVFNKDGGQLYESLDELKRVAIDAGLEIDEFNRVTKQLPQIVADAVAQAQEAAIASALASLRGAESFTEMEEAVQKLQGAAAALPSLLEDLGMSAEEAAAAIEESLLVAMDKLQRSLRDDLTRSINDLADSGFLNEFWDAQLSFQTRLRDLEALGMPTGLAFEELGLRVRQIAGDAELTSDQLMQLAGVFPEIGAAILGAMGGGNTASAVSDAKAKLDEAKADLRAAYDAEKASIEQVISRMQNLTKSLKAFLNDIRIDSSLSPLSNLGKLEEAQKQFRDLAEKALAGDEDALSQLESTSRDYLDRAKAYWASSEGYFQIFGEVERVLNEAVGVAGNQLSEAELQLQALERQVKGLVDVDKSVKTVADALRDLRNAEDAHAAAERANQQYQNSLFERMIAIMGELRAAGPATAAAAYLQGNPDITKAISKGYDGGTGSTDIGVIADAHWQDHGRFENREVGLKPQTRGEKYLANNPDVLAGILAGQKFGASSSDLEVLAKAHWDLHGRFENRLHGYRQGGFTGFGGVNEVAGLVHGQEFVMHSEATRRWRPQFEAMNAGVNPFANDNSAVVAALRQEIGALTSEVKRLGSIVAHGAQETVVAVKEGNAELADVSDELKRANSR